MEQYKVKSLPYSSNNYNSYKKIKSPNFWAFFMG